MGLMTRTNGSTVQDAHLVAHAALVLAERAYADGHAEEAEHLVNVAHRLFGAALQSPGKRAALQH